MKTTLQSIDEFLRSTKDHLALYRGQRDFRYDLQPSVGRTKVSKTGAVKREKQIFERFKCVMRDQWASTASDLELLVLGRHHGLDTRLLDWTRDPLVALYFAFLGFDEDQCIAPSVYVLDRAKIIPQSDISPDIFSASETYFFEPFPIHDRVRQQKSVMSIHSDPFAPFHGNNLKKVVLSVDSEGIRSLEELIQRSGMSLSTIFPGISSTCAVINSDTQNRAERLLINRHRRTEWKPVPLSWSLRPWDVNRKLIIEIGAALEVLELLPDLTLIGDAVYRDAKIMGYLVGYVSSDGLWLFETKSNEVRYHPVSDGSTDKLRFDSKRIREIFPNNDFTLRTRRPRGIKSGFRNPVVGSEVYVRSERKAPAARSDICPTLPVGRRTVSNKAN